MIPEIKTKSLKRRKLYISIGKSTPAAHLCVSRKNKENVVVKIVFRLALIFLIRFIYQLVAVSDRRIHHGITLARDDIQAWLVPFITWY